VADGTMIRARIQSSGLVAFDNVSFAYPESGKPVLRNLSFQAGPDQMVAIVGPSGSGKSTIAKLLLRFYDADAGRVLLDGADIRNLSLRTLRHNVTLLQQENLLFSETIADNIGYGKRGATPAEIGAAARAAGAHEFIAALPDGYQTPVGQRGRLLSGGQRQRIVIVRATLRAACPPPGRQRGHRPRPACLLRRNRRAPPAAVARLPGSARRARRRHPGRRGR
jgi:ATP-binding cassette subfamily B protein